MTSAPFEQAAAACDQYRALLAVPEAIASHCDLPALFHNLASRLHQVARFDYLALQLHEAAGNTLRLARAGGLRTHPAPARESLSP